MGVLQLSTGPKAKASEPGLSVKLGGGCLLQWTVVPVVNKVSGSRMDASVQGITLSQS